MTGNTMTDSKTTIGEIKERVKAFRKERGWTETDQKDVAISITLEAAEILEHFQWVKTQEVKGDSKWRKAVGEEIADVIFLLMELAESLGINVAQAFEKKLEKQAKKYPVSEFNPEKSREEQMRAYYKVKAKTRTDYPFAQEE